MEAFENANVINANEIKHVLSLTDLFRMQRSVAKCYVRSVLKVQER